MPIGAMQMHNRLRLHSGKAARIAIDNLLRYADRLVGRVVQQLDLEAVARILQPADRVDQPVDHELLVEDRQLDGHEGQLALGVSGSRLVPLRRLLLVVVVQPHQLVAMDPIKRQDHHHHEVRNQHRDVERVPAIQAAKGVVPVVRVHVVGKTLGGQKHGQRGMQFVQEGWQGNTPQQGCRSLTILREAVTERARRCRLHSAYAKYIHEELGSSRRRRRDVQMKTAKERMWERLRTPRVMTSISLRIPESVIEDLEGDCPKPRAIRDIRG